MAIPSVRPFVRLAHGWISQKRLKLELYSFHHTVAPSLLFLLDKFHREILMGFPEWGPQSRVGRAKSDFSIFVQQYLENGARYDQSYY